MKDKLHNKIWIINVLGLLCMFISVISFGQNMNTILDLHRGDTLKETYGFNSFRAFSFETSDSLVIKEIENELRVLFVRNDQEIIKKFQPQFDTYIGESSNSGDRKIEQLDTNVFSLHKQIQWDDRWKLVSLKEIYWFQQGGSEPLFRMDSKYFDVAKSIKSFQTSELFSFCAINDGAFQKGFPLTYLPSISFERDCPYNHKWTISHLDCPISECKELGKFTTSIPNSLFCEEYHSEFLVLRYVNSYPHGSMTSWYKEKVYFFKKEKL